MTTNDLARARIEETGEIIVVRGDRARVRAQAHSGCARCTARSGCATGANGPMPGRVVEFEATLPPEHLRAGMVPGASVRVAVPADAVLRAALTIWGVPLAVALSVTLVLPRFVPGVGDGVLGASVLVSFALALVLAARTFGTFERTAPSVRPHVLGLVPEPDRPVHVSAGTDAARQEAQGPELHEARD